MGGDAGDALGEVGGEPQAEGVDTGGGGEEDGGGDAAGDAAGDHSQDQTDVHIRGAGTGADALHGNAAHQTVDGQLGDHADQHQHGGHAAEQAGKYRANDAADQTGLPKGRILPFPDGILKAAAANIQNK